MHIMRAHTHIQRQREILKVQAKKARSDITTVMLRTKTRARDDNDTSRLISNLGCSIKMVGRLVKQEKVRLPARNQMTHNFKKSVKMRFYLLEYEYSSMRFMAEEPHTSLSSSLASAIFICQPPLKSVQGLV